MAWLLGGILAILAGSAGAQTLAPPIAGWDGGVSAGFYDPAFPGHWGPPAQHLGVDIPAPKRTEVLSPVAGQVVANNTMGVDGLEAYMVIRADDSGHEHVLAYLRSPIAVGERVAIGQPLGNVVRTPAGSFLHWGVNVRGVAAAIDSSRGWSFARGPIGSSPQDAAARGWVDPLAYLADPGAAAAPSLPPATEPQPAPPTASAEPVPETGFGPFAAVPEDLDVIGCAEALAQGDRPGWEDCLRRGGASEAAIRFARRAAQPDALDQDAVMLAYHEYGAVDVADILLPTLANTNWQQVYVAGEEILSPGSHLDDSQPRDAGSRAVLARFPEAFASGRLSVVAHRQLDGGVQRFVVTDVLTNGCRACEVAGLLVAFQEFGPGGFLRADVLGWAPMPAEDPEAEAQAIAGGDVLALQRALNMAGYDAGPMDGASGPRTRAALRAFRGDYCFAPDAGLDLVQARALLEANRQPPPQCEATVPPPGADAQAAEAALGLTRNERREIQRRLTLIGFDTGGADGVFGAKSRSAIAGWQQARGYPGTGYLDAPQLAALRSESEALYAEWQRTRPRVTRPAPPRTRVRVCSWVGPVRVCSFR